MQTEMLHNRSGRLDPKKNGCFRKLRGWTQVKRKGKRRSRV